MNTGNPVFVYTILGIGAAGVCYLLFRLVGWARKGKKGAVFLAAAMFSLGFAPDPNYAKNLRIIQEAKEEEGEQDKTGEPPTADDGMKDSGED
jgi:hypothetical protein